MQIPEKIEVQQPNGSHSRYVSEHEARELIRTGAALGLGNKRKFYALRLVSQEANHSERLFRDLKADSLSGVPVIRPCELLAPSPRRHFGFVKAVNRHLRGSSQHEIGARRLMVEASK